MTNVSPQKLEEFESTFRHFDRENANSLNAAEFKAAVSALGILLHVRHMSSAFMPVFLNCNLLG
jgi:Ca2+-binding EF-hand superfamily protein